MKSPCFALLLLSLCSVSTAARGELLWLLNFNGHPEGPAPRRLTALDPAEVVVTRFLEQPERAEAGRSVIVKSDGPDGGKALELRAGSVRNGAGYVTPPRSGSLDTNTLTYEALVKPFAVAEPEKQGYQILNSQPGGTIPQSTLGTDGAGTVSFTNAVHARVRGELPPGRWSHIAAVYLLADEAGGESRLKLYINGRLAGEETFARPAGRIPRALGLGRYLQDAKSDSFQGQIDAVAVSGTALEPGQFVLPQPR